MAGAVKMRKMRKIQPRVAEPQRSCYRYERELFAPERDSSCSGVNSHPAPTWGRVFLTRRDVEWWNEDDGRRWIE